MPTIGAFGGERLDDGGEGSESSRSGGGLRVGELGESEIQQLDVCAGLAAGQHDVTGLEVAMDDVLAVGLVERFADLDRHAVDVGQRQRPARQPLRERFALDVLHDGVRRALVIADIVQGADVGVVEGGDGAGLALEALQGFGTAAEALREDLDGHNAIEPGVAGPVDLAHAAGAGGGNNLVGPQARAGSKRHLVIIRLEARVVRTVLRGIRRIRRR